MTANAGFLRGCVPWFLYGGLFLGLGIVVGQCLPLIGVSLLPRSAAPVWSEPPTGVAAQPVVSPLPSLAPLVDQVSNSVVGIGAFNRRDSEPTVDGAELPGPSAGSGFVFHEDGLVLTNHHLVAGRENLRVSVAGRRIRAELVGFDEMTDLAVLRLKSVPEGLVPLRLGDSTEVHRGDWVMTVGSPYRFSGTVTVGIVSSIGRQLREPSWQVTNEFLQFSAPVNPGSSGSPVLDMRGNVVGITTRNHVEGQGISFAVPSKVIKWVLAALEGPDGRARRAHLGILIGRLSAKRAAEYGVESGRGVRVSGVQNGSAADVAGLARGDVILTYDGRAVGGVAELYDWITYSQPGRRVEMEVLRPDEGRRPVSVTLGEVGKPTAPAATESGEDPE